MITYRNVSYEFNWMLWKEVIQKLAEQHGADFMAEYLGVAPVTIFNWQRDNTSYEDFKHPSMYNFMKVINEIDVPPSHFFTTGE